jgi:hypothetical protein
MVLSMVFGEFQQKCTRDNSKRWSRSKDIDQPDRDAMRVSGDARHGKDQGSKLKAAWERFGVMIDCVGETGGTDK